MTYVFDNSAPLAADRLKALADVHDASSIRHLTARGVCRGWKCLEIGGGLGTITRWLSKRVGPDGYVMATDIDTRFLETLQLTNVEVLRHDILTDPLPEATFDLAVARLVLEHLPDPDTALDRIISAVRPGGWVLVEDLEPADSISKSMAALHDVAAQAGVHFRLALSLPRRLRARGLVCLGNEGRVRLCQGDSPAARLARLNLEQLRDPILATGRLTVEEFETDLARLGDEEFVWRSATLWSAWGRRPEISG
jgi:SAM-dependent methyltransferase